MPASLVSLRARKGNRAVDAFMWQDLAAVGLLVFLLVTLIRMVLAGIPGSAAVLRRRR